LEARWVGATWRAKRGGEPFVVLSGGAEKADERGVSKVWISPNHTEQTGMATIILEGEA
jgi:phosphopantetheinyl transferase (holo-ACP synthase)